mmetsp:Transcript_125985/g.246970  ORF Transcript_125985/g.246970 Transcript_125985/m.246970 type:complete len:347 (+) Transcript_125985:164-1204(+)
MDTNKVDTTNISPRSDVDPNTLWGTSDGASFNARTKKTKPTGESLVALNDNPIEAAEGLHKNISTFWKTNETVFKSFWDKMLPKSRENFLRDVYPTIVQSISDRYCYLNGEKVYENRYDRYLLLAPELTVAALSKDNELPELITLMVKEDALSTGASYMVTSLRRLYKQNHFPFTPSEREAEIKQFNIVKGSYLVANHPDKFGVYFQVDKPELIKKSMGGTVNLFESGILSYPFEFDIVLDTLIFMYGMIGAFLDEFRVEVMRQRIETNVKICSPQYACKFCGTSGSCGGGSGADGVKLLVCAQCNVTLYCSRDCQKRHWPKHKKLCKNISEKAQKVFTEKEQNSA